MQRPAHSDHFSLDRCFTARYLWLRNLNTDVAVSGETDRWWKARGEMGWKRSFSNTKCFLAQKTRKTADQGTPTADEIVSWVATDTGPRRAPFSLWTMPALTSSRKINTYGTKTIDRTTVYWNDSLWNVLLVEVAGRYLVKMILWRCSKSLS